MHSPESAGDDPMAAPQRSAPRSRVWLRLRRRPAFWVATGLIVLLVVVAIVPALFTGRDPAYCDLALSRRGPGGDALLGYNLQGCDVYARTVYGARASVLVGVLATVTVVVIGGVVGTVAGYAGGWVDSVLSRLTDVFFGIPLLLGALVVLVAFPSDEFTAGWQTIAKVVLALGVLGWTTVARVARAAALQTRHADYVQVARAVGGSHLEVIRRHVLPSVFPPVLAWSTMAVGGFIAVEATLSFIGIGLQPPVISWGIEISEAQSYVRQSPHMLLVPSAALSLTVFAFMTLGETVRSALDPRTHP